MPVVLYQKMPPEASLEMIKAVTDEMGVRSDPPEGLIVHTVIDMGGQLAICDVWETREAYEKFGETRLGPAFAAVAQRMGMNPDDAPQPATELLDTLDIVRGS